MNSRMRTQQITLGALGAALCMIMVTTAGCQAPESGGLLVGWSRADITPDKPVLMPGFFKKRVSRGVRDPLTATVLAMETVGSDGKVTEQAIMVSCDLISIGKSNQDAVKRIIKDRLPGFDSDKLFMNATHTHQGALTQSGVFRGMFRLTPEERARGVMTGNQYGEFLAGRVAEAVVKAWKGRKPGGYSWAIDQAVVGFNRRFMYSDGKTRMLAGVNTPEFDCIEGVEDHGLSLLCFWSPDRKLTGMVINVASPAQAEQGHNRISADFWHDVREEIAERYSEDVFVFPQCGAAGDIYTKGMFRHRAEAKMARRKGISWRREIGRRIADGVDRALPVARKDIDFKPAFKHTVARVDLAVEAPKSPPLYVTDSVKQTEIHVVRLGDVAVVTNPFELFIDYGIRMQARSKAILTFVVQLSCQASGYLPTTRAIRGGGYSAEKYIVGPAGGKVLVDESVKRINALWR